MSENMSYADLLRLKYRLEILKKRIIKEYAEFSKNTRRLQDHCPHENVYETRPDFDWAKRTIKAMYSTRRICTLCQLQESSFHGFKALEHSKVIEKITDDELKKRLDS